MIQDDDFFIIPYSPYMNQTLRGIMLFQINTKKKDRWRFQSFVIFVTPTPFWEDSNSDLFLSKGLKPPTRKCSLSMSPTTHRQWTRNLAVQDILNVTPGANDTFIQVRRSLENYVVAGGKLNEIATFATLLRWCKEIYRWKNWCTSLSIVKLNCVLGISTPNSFWFVGWPLVWANYSDLSRGHLNLRLSKGTPPKKIPSIRV